MLKVIVYLLPLAALLAAGCGGAPAFECPTSGDDVTWTSYGRFTIGGAGSDSTARDCISKCGWSVFGGNNGGVGNTLQIASPNGGVVFAWANNSFSAFRLTSGWTGKTDRGVKIGDSEATFLSHYPEFGNAGPHHMMFTASSGEIDAYFSPNGALTELHIGNYIVP